MEKIEIVDFVHCDFHHLPLIDVTHEELPEISPLTLSELTYLAEKYSKVIDIGCNVGILIKFIYKKTKKKIYGLDISLNMCKIAAQDKNSIIIRGDALSIPIQDGTFGLVSSIMLIEHLDNKKFIKEISRIMKNDAYLVLGSVLKRKGAWYIYKNKFGESVLTPDHIKEYTSTRELTDLLEANNFVVEKIIITQLKYPIFDIVFKLLLRFLKRLSKSSIRKIYQNKIIQFLRIFKIPILNYYRIDVIAKKSE